MLGRGVWSAGAYIRFPMTKLRALSLCAVAIAVAGCSKKEASGETAARPRVASQGDEATTSSEGRVVMPRPGSAGAKELADRKPTTALTDSEIAHITDVVNNGEIEQAQVAKNKAATPQVKLFAE